MEQLTVPTWSVKGPGVIPDAIATLIALSSRWSTPEVDGCGGSVPQALKRRKASA
jgi:hypothetical protein